MRGQPLGLSLVPSANLTRDRHRGPDHQPQADVDDHPDDREGKAHRCQLRRPQLACPVRVDEVDQDHEDHTDGHRRRLLPKYGGDVPLQ